MLTSEELHVARNIVSKALKQFNNDRVKTFKHIEELCARDPDLQFIFAKVGANMTEAQTATRH